MISNTNWLFDLDIPLMNISLPLAISFFTFQQIAFLVDCYKYDSEEYDFLNYTIFISFFPQLVSGPIVHHKEMMPQFASARRLIKNYENILIGILMIFLGLFKKLYIADPLEPLVANGFDVAESVSFADAWVAALGFTFQIYFDFSGYTDIALGSSLLFNIRLPINFNSPYKAVNIQDFWRRWHVTLSSFFRSHIYIPLGGNKNGLVITCGNLFMVFLIGGLWHGAQWTFVAWGALHGLAIVTHRMFKEFNLKMNRVPGWVLTFLFVNFTWVFFRAPDFTSATRVLRGMVDIDSLNVLAENASAQGILPYMRYDVTASFFLMFVVVLFLKNSNEISQLLYKTKLFKF